MAMIPGRTTYNVKPPPINAWTIAPSRSTELIHELGFCYLYGYFHLNQYAYTFLFCIAFSGAFEILLVSLRFFSPKKTKSAFTGLFGTVSYPESKPQPAKLQDPHQNSHVILTDAIIVQPTMSYSNRFYKRCIETNSKILFPKFFRTDCSYTYLKIIPKH